MVAVPVKAVDTKDMLARVLSQVAHELPAPHDDDGLEGVKIAVSLAAGACIYRMSADKRQILDMFSLVGTTIYRMDRDQILAIWGQGGPT